MTQNGDGNNALTNQKDGSYNVVNLTQSDGADANIVQDGSHNTVQGIGAAAMGTSLNGSTLDVNQLGTSNTLHLQQTNGANASVMQNGITNTAVVIQN